ncbi:MAG: transketolase [Rhodospirillaceae bacterium]|nr:transketolase [Rhodospirillaceae bacterium]
MPEAPIQNDMGSLEQIAQMLRHRIIKTSHESGTPHLGSCLSCIDLLVFLYWHILQIDPTDPTNPKRDRFLLSKGHAAPALFQVLAERGFFPVSDLNNYGEDGSLFGEHPPTPSALPGIEAATGSLGHGLPIGLGMALASRISDVPYSVYAILSDGECNEGSVWEAALLAAAQKVSNLTVAIDYNKWQATGRSNEVLGLAPLAEKWSAFGWCVSEIDGHNLNQMADAIEKNRNDPRPKAIIANTVKGRGVSFMEDDNNWHYRIPTAEEVGLAAKELGIEA